SENDILAFDGAVQLDTVQLKKTKNIFWSRKIEKLLIASASFITKIQTEVAPQTRVTPPFLIKKMLAIFRCVKTFFVGHQWYPPKLVFLETKREPPWKPRNTQDKAICLEDKARFKTGSIDTSHNLKNQEPSTTLN
nr:hypothetical protein [Tanacetum cinerariifolium]